MKDELLDQELKKASNAIPVPVPDEGWVKSRGRRLRLRSRVASGAAALVVLAGIAVPLWTVVFSPPVDVAGSARPGTLVVHETAVDTSLRGEGYYAYLALERTDGTRLRLVGQKGTAAEPLSLRVEPGSYRLISYQRSCDAACPRLDPERFGYCSTVVSVQSSEAVKLRLSVRPYEGCTISIGH